MSEIQDFSNEIIKKIEFNETNVTNKVGEKIISQIVNTNVKKPKSFGENELSILTQSNTQYTKSNESNPILKELPFDTLFKNYSQVNELEKFIFEINFPPSNEAEVYQQQVLQETTQESGLVEYSDSYKKLVSEQNRPWKINPSDIADFYLCQDFYCKT